MCLLTTQAAQAKKQANPVENTQAPKPNNVGLGGSLKNRQPDPDQVTLKDRQVGIDDDITVDQFANFGNFNRARNNQRLQRQQRDIKLAREAALRPPPPPPAQALFGSLRNVAGRKTNRNRGNKANVTGGLGSGANTGTTLLT